MSRFDNIKKAAVASTKAAFSDFHQHISKKELLGKREDGIEARADAVARARASNDGPASNCTMVAELYESEDNCDRGGVILVLRNDSSAELGYCPHPCNTHNGLELHLCGDEECELMVRSLVQVLLKSRRLRKVVLSEAFEAMKAILTEKKEEVWWR